MPNMLTDRQSARLLAKVDTLIARDDMKSKHEQVRLSEKALSMLTRLHNKTSNKDLKNKILEEFKETGITNKKQTIDNINSQIKDLKNDLKSVKRSKRSFFSKDISTDTFDTIDELMVEKFKNNDGWIDNYLQRKYDANA